MTLDQSALTCTSRLPLAGDTWRGARDAGGSAWEEQGDNKRWWRTTCNTGFRDVVTYRRDGNAL